MKNPQSVTVQPTVNNLSANKTASSSPYLKAVLSGAIQLFKKEQWLDDRAAASRYIKETRLIKG
jgi:SOS response regulatory protein OraA/RecX